MDITPGDMLLDTDDGVEEMAPALEAEDQVRQFPLATDCKFAPPPPMCACLLLTVEAS